MPSTIVYSAACEGSSSHLVRIESSYTCGHAGMQLIGNASEVCRDGKERVRAALEQQGIKPLAKRLVISMTPADLKKDGNHLDLPMAVSLLLLCRDRRPRLEVCRWLFAAELGLSGELRSTKGIVSFALLALAEELEGIVVARENVPEVALVAGLDNGGRRLRIAGFNHVSDVIAWIDGRFSLPPSSFDDPESPDSHAEVGENFDDMVLPPPLRQAAIVACAGMHSMLLRGPPGTGKSMLASRLPSILPPMIPQDQIETMRIYSNCMEKLPRQLLAGRAPIRAPHHNTSAAAVLGSPDQPGELSLSHGGILFLDELPEFRRDVIEALREPLESGKIEVSRARRRGAWFAKTMLVAACNNCPCGWRHSSVRVCDCTENQVRAYARRMSGPILDRIDIHVNVLEPAAGSSAMFLTLSMDRPSQTAGMAAAVLKARLYSAKRNRKFNCLFNRDLTGRCIVKAFQISEKKFTQLVEAVIPDAVSNRSALRAFRVARTIADVDQRLEVSRADLETAWTWQSEGAAAERGDELGRCVKSEMKCIPGYARQSPGGGS